MSEIRRFRGKKQQNNAKPKQSDLLRKIWLHRLSVFYRLALALILVVVVIVILVRNANNKVYSEYSVSSSVEWSGSSNRKVVEYNGRILSYSKDGMVCTSLKGKTLWNQSYEMQNPIVSTCEDYVAVGDYNGTTIYIMNESGPLGTIDTRLPIRALSVSAKGTVVAVLDDAPNTLFNLYNVSGNILWGGKSSMSISGYPVDVTVSPNSMMVAVSYLYADTGSLTSKVAFYNLDEVGDNYQDTLVSAFNYNDAVVPLVHFMDNENSFALADNRLMFYSGTQIPASTKDVLLSEEVQKVFYNSKYVALVFLNMENGEKYHIDVYNASGTLKHKYYTDMDVLDIRFRNDMVYLYNDARCEIYTLKGKEKFVGALDTPALLLLPTSSKNKLVLVGREEIQNITLK